MLNDWDETKQVALSDAESVEREALLIVLDAASKLAGLY